MDKQSILSHLDFKRFYTREFPSLRVNGHTKVQVLCPFHEDTRPSLSLNLEDGSFHCFGCEEHGNVFDYYMEKYGVDFRTAMEALAEYAGLSEEVPRKISETYDYTDESGALLYNVVRYEPKGFGQRRPDGNGGWVYNMKDVRLVPYRLPEIRNAESVIVVEGEKDVETLRRVGLVATCNAMGAGKWRQEYNEHFSEKDVAVLPDNDEPGRQHAEKVAKNLKGVARSVKVVKIPGLPEKGDVTDWMSQGGTSEALLKIIEATPEWSPYDFLSKALRRGAEVMAMDLAIEYAVEGLIPLNAITLFPAPGGIGKSTLGLQIANAISKGEPIFELPTKKLHAVYIDLENPLMVVVERFRKIDAKDVQLWHNTNEILPPRLDSTEWESLKELPPGAVIVIDTLRAMQGQDENDSRHMTLIMQRLQALRDMGFTIIVLHHTKKSDDKKYRGSSAIYDQCDHVTTLFRVRVKEGKAEEINDDPTSEDDETHTYRLGTRDKTRYAPFHIFIQFNRETGLFELAPDPDEETLTDMQALIRDRGEVKTGDFQELVQKRLGIKSIGRTTQLLRKGTGRYWTTRQEGRSIYYSFLPSSTPVYERSIGEYTENGGLSSAERHFSSDEELIDLRV